MMKKFLVVSVAAALIFGALNYHVIIMDRSVKILKKADISFDNTFVDARGAKKIKVLLNPALVKSGVKDILSSK